MRVFMCLKSEKIYLIKYKHPLIFEDVQNLLKLMIDW